MKLKYWLIALISMMNTCDCFFDPFSWYTAGYGTAALGAYLLVKKDVPNRILEYSGCKSGYMECCEPPWISFDAHDLQKKLRLNVFGQHIVVNTIPAALAAQKNRPASKALVLSFHGWPGGGKNFVAKFIAESYFKKGMESNYYHFFNGRTHFPEEKHIELYQENLRRWISGNVTKCRYSIFVFDEVDKMPKGVLDSIKLYVDHHPIVDGVDYRSSTFVFLSNTGGNLITERYLELWKRSGKMREEMTLNDFDKILSIGAHNERGGLQKSDLVDHNVVDHYVPFLPLEREHVIQCIQAELHKYGQEPSQGIIDEVMKVVTFGPKPENRFSTSGCKRISQKISTIIERERLREHFT